MDYVPFTNHIAHDPGHVQNEVQTGVNLFVGIKGRDVYLNDFKIMSCIEL